ncbi:MAG: thiolase [Actinomycetia bacterium]|nr:thiolase [Actinomycetes bacterium]
MPSTREAVIVGVAESDLGVVPGLSPLDLMAQAAIRALADAGLDKREVDGLLAASAYYYMPTVSLGEYLGIVPRYTDSTTIGGSSFVAHLRHAKLAVESGACEVALIAYGSTQRSDGGALVTMAEPLPYEIPHGLPYPIGAYALAARRHMAEFGTTPEQLAAVAVQARAWALLNPKAFMHDRGPLTVEDVLASPLIADPLHLLDCCLVTDGGGAVVVTTRERARDLPRRPVRILGAGESHTHRGIMGMPDLTTTAARYSGAQAFAEAGLRPADIDFVELYDAFTINTILFLEDLGFCPKGEGGPFVAEGRIGPGGVLPVNTNGGGLSYCHPGMYGIFTIIEAVRQLRGEAGARQLARARVGLVHGNGGTLSSQCTAILGID